jgi:hypothetical protein
MNRFHDIEQLSAYLDGQLSPSDSARLESRLQSDPELASAYNDLRSTRGILRKLPSRRAPRNFTLTRKMVGLNPPLPRTYFGFRFATAFATILFAFTVAVNNIAPRITYNPLYVNYGSGGGGCTWGCGGGGAPDTVYQAPLSELATEEALATTQAPVAGQMMPTPTIDEDTSAADAAADTENAERVTETPTTKEPPPGSPNQGEEQTEALVVPIVWQVGLLIVIVIGAFVLFLMNQSAKRKWQ